jgi:hypothetical protein
LLAFQEVVLKFEWDEDQLTDEQREEVQQFQQRIDELGLDNAFYDEEALVYIDGTHVPIPSFVRVIRD